jgi:steroid 5-alpha reductase family enzyme
MVVYVIDRYYLVISFLITLGWQVLGFFIAWTLQFDKITDFTGGSNFFVLALVTLLLGNTFYARNVVASVLQMVWAARLGGFLLFRVLKTGSDNRFDEIRSHFFKFAGFWVGQIVWVWTVCESQRDPLLFVLVSTSLNNSLRRLFQRFRSSS